MRSWPMRIEPEADQVVNWPSAAMKSVRSVHEYEYASRHLAPTRLTAHGRQMVVNNCRANARLARMSPMLSQPRTTSALHHNDHLGTPLALSDESGVVVAEWVRDPLETS